MFARIVALKTKHKELETRLKLALAGPALNDNQVKEIKKRKLHIKDTIVKLVRKKSTLRKKRYSLRTKRLTRLGNAA